MATWTPTATIKAGVTNGKPGIGTGGFGDQTADNLQYLYDRVNSVGLNTGSGIHDDFTATTLDDSAQSPYTWDISGTPDMGTAPDHWLHTTNGSGTDEGVAASPYKMRFDLDRDHTLYFETRHKSLTSDLAQAFCIGFKDASYAPNASTLTDVIMFRQGSSVAQSYRAYCAKAGVNVTVADDQVAAGGAGSWVVLRIEITFSGATKKVEFFMDGVSIGSTTDTTKIPLVQMRPGANGAGGGGLRNHQWDYIDADWTARPLSN